MKFTVGGLYFWIRYADQEHHFLMPESIVFLGLNLEPNLAEPLWYFQDAKSYCVYGPETFVEPFEREIDEAEFARFTRKMPPTVITSLPEANLYQVVDCEGLARSASECAKRRASAGRPI